MKNIKSLSFAAWGCAVFLSMASCSDAIELDEVQYRDYAKMDTLGYEGYTLAWSDEFEDEGLPNPESWDYEEGYLRNNEWQDYRREDLKYSYMKNGSMFLQADVDKHEGINPWTNEPYSFDYSSASLTTMGKVDFKFGRIDIAAKIPTEVSLFPSFFLSAADPNLGVHSELYFMQHVYGSGDKHDEITVKVNTQNMADGAEEVASGSLQVKDLDTKFHLYSVVWDNKVVELLCDNQSLAKYERPEKSDESAWPFNNPLCLTMNLAVGGTYGGAYGRKPDAFPQHMEIKYVRYYKLINEPDEPDGSDEPDASDEPDEPVNMVENGDFEEPFAEGKEPKYLKDYDITHDGFMNHLNQWFSKQENLSVDSDGEYGKVLLFNGDIKDRWNSYVRYSMTGIPAGKYELKFDAKSDQGKGSVLAGIVVYEIEDDIKNGNSLKCPSLYIDDKGEQSFCKDEDKYYPIKVCEVNQNWQTYSVQVDIPTNTAIMFNFGMHLTWDYAKKDHNMVGKGTVKYWIDNVSLIPVTEESTEKK